MVSRSYVINRLEKEESEAKAVRILMVTNSQYNENIHLLANTHILTVSYRGNTVLPGFALFFLEFGVIVFTFNTHLTHSKIASCNRNVPAFHNQNGNDIGLLHKHHFCTIP